MTYNEARDILDSKHGNKDSKRLANNTYLIRKDGYFAIRLHETDIIELYPDYFVLNNGDWFTMTTKERINRFSNVYVSQSNSIWFIGQYLYQNGTKVKYNGVIVNPIKTDKTIKAVNKMKKRINKYADGFVKSDYKNNPPSNGDCFYCIMITQDKKTLGDAIKDKDHLLNHLTEKYYVPSLMINALKDTGYKDPSFIIHMGLDSSIKRSIVKYMQKRLLPR